MELRDLIVTPIILFIVYAAAYVVRPWVTDAVNRRYFLPALTVRIIGALAVGFLYQFYYEGGDTFNYHTHGSRQIWNAVVDDAEQGLKLLGSGGTHYQGVYEHASRIVFRTDPSSMVIVRLAAIIDLFTFSAYSATAVVFAIIAFVGAWALFITFYSMAPSKHAAIAVATMFIPSVVFWGSGLLKDTVTLSCLGLAVYSTYRIFLRRDISMSVVLLLAVSLYGLYLVKIYILLTFLPAAIIWVASFNYSRIKSLILKITFFPVLVVVAGALSFYAILKAGEDNPKYSFKAIARTAQITAYDIRYWSGRDAGSGYSLGELDGTWKNMIALAPAAINVSLFRPYLWEVRNPLMALSALESLALILLTFYVVWRSGLSLFKALGTPHVMFCLIFSIAFAFAVGVSTFNFGTLARYKIPLLPFYLLALIFILDHSKSDRKVGALALTEY